jgi:hypothetical protein
VLPSTFQHLTMAAAPNAVTTTTPPIQSTLPWTYLCRRGSAPQPPPPQHETTPQHHLIHHQLPSTTMMMSFLKRRDPPMHPQTPPHQEPRQQSPCPSSASAPVNVITEAIHAISGEEQTNSFPTLPRPPHGLAKTQSQCALSMSASSFMKRTNT